MEIPNYQSRGQSPKTSGLDPANPGIVGGGPIVQGLSNAASGLLVYAHQQQQVEQLKQMNMASGHLARLGNLFDSTWGIIQKKQLVEPKDPQTQYDEFNTFMQKAIDDTLNLQEVQDNPHAQRYISEHIPTILHGRNQEALKQTFAQAKEVAKFDYAQTLNGYAQSAISNPSGPKVDEALATAHIKGALSTQLDANPSETLAKWREQVNFGIAANLVSKDPASYLRARRNGEYPKGGRWDHVSWDRMDEQQFTKIHGIATGQIDRNRTEDARANEAKQKVAMQQIADTVYGTVDKITKRVIPPGDASHLIESSQDVLTGEQYESAKALNAKLIQARKAEVTAYQVGQSAKMKSVMLNQAARAMFEPQLLSTTINEAIVGQHMIAGTLVPDDTPEVYAAIVRARLHHETGDTSTRKAETAAYDTLKVYKPQLMDSKQALLLDAAEKDMQQTFTAWRLAHPTATATDMQEAAHSIRARGTERILATQKFTMDDLDNVLHFSERHMPEGLVKGNHELDPAMRKTLEEAHPELKGIFAIHDQRRKRWEYKSTEAEKLAEQQNNVKR